MLLYRLLSPLIVLLVIGRAIIAIVRRRERFDDLMQRMVGPQINGPVLWVHAASVGEVNAAKPVIEHLSQHHNMVVTATTITGRDAAQRWGLQNVTSGLAPLDLGWTTRRFIRRAQIAGLIIVENELWPTRILACQSANLPVCMVNARMSVGTMRTWAKFPNTARRMFANMTMIAPQDVDSATRFETLGAPVSVLRPPQNLKTLYVPNTAPIPGELAGWVREQTLLAAATHDGEEKIVLEAFQRLREQQPDLKLILAPRHPERGQMLVALARSFGLDPSLRSASGDIHSAVYIADTLHEMHFWYRVSGAAFVGGSLIEKGGHTPFEPVAYGCPIIHGPHVSNFRDAYRALDDSNAASLVADAASLAVAFKGALVKPHSRYPTLPEQASAQALFSDLNKIFG